MKAKRAKRGRPRTGRQRVDITLPKEIRTGLASAAIPQKTNKSAIVEAALRHYLKSV
jgi:metal-responsive CopG/Arc/MetJ family transcriptional regulator